MIYAFISLCALVLVAFTLAVVALLTCMRHTRERESWQSKIVSDLQKRLASIAAQSASVSSKLHDLERGSPVKLAAEVAALSAAVTALGDTHRRFAGRVWQRIGTQDRAPELPYASTGVGDLDPELAAEIALQSAPAVSPGAR